MTVSRKPYPSDVCDEEWVLVAPYLALLPEDAGQRDHSLREVFNGLRYVIRSGCAWRLMPHDLPPWAAVYQQAQRWLAAGCFEHLADDLRVVLRLAAGRKAEPSAAVLDSRTLRSTPESGQRAGYDGAKRKRGSKLHMAVDTLGHLIALHVTPASADDRAEVGRLAKAVQTATGGSNELAYVDQGYRACPREGGGRQAGCGGGEAGHQPGGRQAAQGQARLRAPSTALGRRAQLCLATRFRRLVKDYEGYASTLAGLHIIAFVCLMLRKVALLATGS